jgi:hypothetical protein
MRRAGDLEDFIRAWQGGQSLEAVAAEMHMTPRQTSRKASVLRTHGIELKRFEARLDIERLQMIAKEGSKMGSNGDNNEDQNETKSGSSGDLRKDVLRLLLVVEARAAQLLEPGEDLEEALAERSEALDCEPKFFDPHEVLERALYGTQLEPESEHETESEDA